MQVAVNISLYEYGHEQVKNKENEKKKKRNFIENKYVNRKLNKGGGNSVSRAPVGRSIILM